ncbi:MAG: DUF983 domain-containing protein [Bacteroidota bacterium]
MSDQKQYPSQFEAFRKGKCPRCRKGDCFTHPVYSLKFGRMNDRCPNCGFRFEIEPGFFWGSMYISYGFLVAEALIVGFGLFLTVDPDMLWYAVAIIATALVFMPFNYRTSRLAMIHYFSQVDFVPAYYDNPVPKEEWKDEGRAVDNLEELMKRPQHTIND